MDGICAGSDALSKAEGFVPASGYRQVSAYGLGRFLTRWMMRGRVNANSAGRHRQESTHAGKTFKLNAVEFRR
jgi:hypothetical protein